MEMNKNEKAGKDEGKDIGQNRKIVMAVVLFLLTGIIIAAGVIRSAGPEAGESQAEQKEADAGQARETEGSLNCPVRNFTNLCAYGGQVYCGAHGFFGKEIPVESNVFTIWDEKIYYVEKVQEAYDSLTDELMEIKRSDMDGGSVEVLADDVFLAGAGYEKLIGDKLFYGYGYDENHSMQYAWVDVNTKEKGTISTDRIESILGYDGVWLYYRGTDRESGQNVLGRVKPGADEDEILYGFAGMDEEGYIENAFYEDGRLYCFTLTHKPEGYDYRTFLYRMEIRDKDTGELAGELPVDFTGSANYSFLIQDGELYTAMAGEIVAITLTGGEKRTVARMKEGEYWGILYFVPGDGYLYYEAIAEVNEETGNNDYFYRVPAEGGEEELLNEWYTA